MWWIFQSRATYIPIPQLPKHSRVKYLHTSKKVHTYYTYLANFCKYKKADRYAIFYALFMLEKAGPKKEEFNFNVGTSTCKKYIGTGSMVCALFFHIIPEESRRNISSQISIFELQTILSCRCCCKHTYIDFFKNSKINIHSYVVA